MKHYYLQCKQFHFVDSMLFSQAGEQFLGQRCSAPSTSPQKNWHICLW